MQRNRLLVALGALAAAVLLLGLAATTHTVLRTLEREALLQQHSRAREVANQLDAYREISEQLVNTTAELAGPLRQPAQVEGLLRKVLASTPSELVYGVGVWFEPYRFDPARRYFGPYARRGPAGPEVTYVWSTPAYDYPGHDWFRQGQAAGRRPSFTEPYFDLDYVYVSTIRAIFDEGGRRIGVVSVDLILPQLQRVVGEANGSPRERVFVTSRDGRLLAHPEADLLLGWAHRQGRPARTLADLTLADLDAFRRERPGLDDLVEVVEPVAGLGWQVHLASKRGVVFHASRHYRGEAVALGVVLCGLLLTLGYARARQREARGLAAEVEERARAEAALRQGMRQQDDFVGLAAHELRTPLTPLATRLQLLRRQLDRGQAPDPRLLEGALVGVDRLTDLISDLLDAARVQAGRMAVALAPASLSQAVRDAVTAEAPPSERHPVILHLPDQEVWVRGDRSRLEQVVANLLQNAIKYSPHGGEIRVTLAQQGDRARVAVSDQGIGIPPQEQQRLFDRYFRARNAPASAFGGLGLGLYICRDIVERHGGRIWVESQEGAGSTFYVELPALPGAARAAPAPAPAPPP